MTVWITGANGFIARHLARELAGRGQTVDGIGYGAPQDAEKKKWGYRTCLNGEISASNLHALASSTSFPSMIYHLAGGSSVGASIAQPQEDFARTVTGTEQLLDWMRDNAPRCRLIAVSSAAVYGSHHAGPITETAELDPMSPYGQHKRMMEQLCQNYADTFFIRSIIVRLFSVYGVALRKQLLWDLCNRLQNGHRQLTLGGMGSEMRDWTNVRDVARLLAILPTYDFAQPCPVLNGGSGGGTSVADIANYLVDSWGGGSSVAFSGERRAGDPTSLISDSSKLAALGFEWTTKLDAGVNEYVQWFKSQSS
jgi:UDP-glucose 4-epimerase